MDSIQTTAREAGEAAARTIDRWFAADHLRDRYGQAARAATLKKMEAGETPTGYRIDWLKKVSKDLVKVLANAKIEFDRQFPWDRCQGEDLGDALATAAGHLHDPSEDGSHALLAATVDMIRSNGSDE